MMKVLFDHIETILVIKVPTKTGGSTPPPLCSQKYTDVRPHFPRKTRQSIIIFSTVISVVQVGLVVLERMIERLSIKPFLSIKCSTS